MRDGRERRSLPGLDQSDLHDRVRDEPGQYDHNEPSRSDDENPAIDRVRAWGARKKVRRSLGPEEPCCQSSHRVPLRYVDRRPTYTACKHAGIDN